MRKILSFIAAFFALFPLTVFADNEMPEKGFGRITWAFVNYSHLPKEIVIGGILLFVLIVIAVIYYKKISGGEN